MDLNQNDLGAWCEDIRRNIDVIVGEHRDAGKPLPKNSVVAPILDDVIQTLSWCESRLAWLRYVANVSELDMADSDREYVDRASLNIPLLNPAVVAARDARTSG